MKETEEQLNVSRKDAYINPQLTTWGGQFKTNFHRADILKIANIYKQGGKYYPQLFVKECKIIENRGSAKPFLDGFETCPSLES